jgi:hypothetical protein
MKPRLFWMCAFGNVAWLGDGLGGVHRAVREKGWDRCLREGPWDGQSPHHTVDSLLARHPFWYFDRGCGVYAGPEEYTAGYGANGKPGMCAVRGPREASPAVLTGMVAALRARNRLCRSRGGESIGYIGSPRALAAGVTTYSAADADNWFREYRQAEFDGVGLDVGGPLVGPYSTTQGGALKAASLPDCPAHVVANRCGAYGMKCWLEPWDRNEKTSRTHNGRFPLIAPLEWALDGEEGRAPGRMTPRTAQCEMLVVVDGALSKTGADYVAMTRRLVGLGYSVAVEPAWMTPAELDACVGLVR